MKSRPGAWVLGLLALAGSPAHASALDLVEALRMARERAVELVEPQARLEGARAETRAVHGLYDPTLFGQTQWGQDKTEQTSIFAGDRRDQAFAEVGVRKLLPSGTALQTRLVHQRDYILFPEPQIPTPPPAGGDAGGGETPAASAEGAGSQGGAAAAAAAVVPFDPAKFQSFNPAYQTRLEVLVRQPLWRNRMGREFRLQEDLAASGEIEPAYARRLAEQGVQAETEQLYWTLAGLGARLDLARQLLEKSRRFASLMEDRRAIGRADRVDVVAAEAAVVAQEGMVLDLEVAAQDVRRRLVVRLALTENESLAVTPAALETAPFPPPASAPAEAAARALSGRLDLALIEASRQPLLLQQRLADEQTRPSLNVFGSGTTNGLEKGLGSSLTDVTHPGYAVGLELEVGLSHTAPRARREAAAAQLAALSARAREIERDARREIELAFQALDGARKKLEQANRHVRTLTEKRDAERAKFLQARSEEVAVLRYDMEIVGARMARVATLQEARQAEARLRLALHAYPRGD